jgi:lysozyme
MDAPGRAALHALLIRHEGLRLKPYTCTAGKLTIGVGRNLDDNGITEAEAMAMLERDITVTVGTLRDHFPWFANLDTTRQYAVISLGFNLGVHKLSTFKRFLAAMASQQYETAAAEILDSTYATQVGKRAIELAAMIRSGQSVEV